MCYWRQWRSLERYSSHQKYAV
ncbi:MULTISPECIES: hypothetical protein [Pseudoalteromonas]